MLCEQAPLAKRIRDKTRGVCDMTVLDQFRLDGKCMLVTGGQPGVRPCDRARGGGSRRRCCAGRARSRSACPAIEVRERNRKAWTFPADIAEPAACEDLCRRVLAEGPSIDILVNNVGGRNIDVAIEDSDLATWRRFIDLNLTHCFICTKMIGGAMLARGEGRIINIASISGMIANRGIGGRHYETAKAAPSAPVSS
jgi:NAD(P)-dependent dehydrogenase (short-subunit alcohol dehydrogenase family)